MELNDNVQNVQVPKRKGRPPGAKDKKPRKSRAGTAGVFTKDTFQAPQGSGDNARFLSFALEAWDLPPVDIEDPDAIAERAMLYFDRCIEADIKPGVAGLCNYLHIDRQTFYTWGVGGTRSYDKRYSHIVKSCYSIIESMIEQGMQTGKINPIPALFMLKNHFGYKDQQDLVVKPEDPLAKGTDPEEVRKRYAQAVVHDDSGALPVPEEEQKNLVFPLPNEAESKLSEP